MNRSGQVTTFVGRKDELRQLWAALRKRESRLLWGPADSGKTALMEAAIAELTEEERRTCIRWTGAASRKELLSHLVARLYEMGNSIVRRKVPAYRDTKASLNRWLGKQSSLRLRGVLFAALTQANCRIFLDHLPSATHVTARLLKEIMYRCKTPIYLIARGYSLNEVGYAWSLYWNDGLRLHVGPLGEQSARDLFDVCVRNFSLDSLDLEEFREGVLRLSGYLPGSIVKMCELAADSRYRCGDQVKIKLVYVDYLMRSNPSALPQSINSPQ